MSEPVLVIYGNNWGLGEYDPATDTLTTPWDFRYNHPPIFRFNYPVPIKTGLFKTVHVDKLVVFNNEKEAIRITSEGLKAIAMVHGIKEYWVRAFQESLPEKEEDWKIMLIKNLGLILLFIALVVAIIT